MFINSKTNTPTSSTHPTGIVFDTGSIVGEADADLEHTIWFDTNALAIGDYIIT